MTLLDMLLLYNAELMQWWCDAWFGPPRPRHEPEVLLALAQRAERTTQ